MFTPGPATSLGSFWTAKTFSLSGSRLENSQPPVAQRPPRLKATPTAPPSVFSTSWWTFRCFSGALQGSEDAQLARPRLENSQPPVAQRLPRLKAIEKYVGFKRKLPESNGAWAMCG
jgi:hypothetical protein